MINPLAFTNLIPAIIGGVKYRKLTPDLKAITWLMIASVLIQIPASYLFVKHQNNAWCTHLYNMVSFACLSIVYSVQLPPVFSPRKIQVIGVLGCLLCVFNAIFFQSLTLQPSYVSSITEIVILTYSLAYLYKLIITDNTEILWNIPMFWVNTGILLFYGLVFFISIGYNLTLNLSKPVNIFINQFRQAFLLIHYLSLGVALWIYRQV